MIRLLVAAEDADGNWTARHLLELRMKRIEWVHDLGLDAFREWMTFRARSWLPLKDVNELFRECLGRGFRRAYGHFAGEPGAENALAFHKLFVVVERLGPDLLVVARDADGTDRRTGFQQARKRPWPFAIAGALAQPEVDAWLICAAIATGEAHRQCIAELRRELGFDPTTSSHDLTSTSPSARDAKRVRERLESAGMDLESSFRARSIGDLRERGTWNGLSTFLADLDDALAPHLGAPP